MPAEAVSCRVLVDLDFDQKTVQLRPHWQPQLLEKRFALLCETQGKSLRCLTLVASVGVGAVAAVLGSSHVGRLRLVATSEAARTLGHLAVRCHVRCTVWGRRLGKVRGGGRGCRYVSTGLNRRHMFEPSLTLRRHGTRSSVLGESIALRSGWESVGRCSSRRVAIELAGGWAVLAPLSHMSVLYKQHVTWSVWLRCTSGDGR